MRFKKAVFPRLVLPLALLLFVAKDVLYLLHHWSGTLSGFARDFITHDVFPHIGNYIVCWGLYISMPILVAGMVVAVKKRLASYYPFVALGAVTMLYGFAWGFFAYQVYPIMYASMLMMPVVLPLLVNFEDNEKLRYELV